MNTMHYVWYTLLGFFAILQTLLLLIPLGFGTVWVFLRDEMSWSDLRTEGLAAPFCALVGALDIVIGWALVILLHALGLYLHNHLR